MPVILLWNGLAALFVSISVPFHSARKGPFAYSRLPSNSGWCLPLRGVDS